MAFRANLTLIIAILALIQSCYVCSYVSAADESDAKTAIAAAEDRLRACYDVVAEADAAKANTTLLLETLNQAGVLLSRAELSYWIGDFDSAFNSANQSQSLLKGFVAEVQTLVETATWTYYWNLLVTVIGSAGGTVAVICGSFVFWHFYKKKHGRSVDA